MTEPAARDYASFLVEVKARIRRRQYQALRAVNVELVQLFWDIGEAIHRKQQSLGWGRSVVETLARDLQAEFPGRNGFSAQNLWLMRQFYVHYCDRPKLQPLAREISWTKNLVILARCRDDLEREFYLRATARFGWTRAALQHQVDNRSYERYLANQTSFDQTLSPAVRAQAILAVKDHYTFDFLNLAEAHSERELERGLVNNLRRFLAEMGGACAFVGNQHRIAVGGQEYFIDLLLFHRRLRCLVAIDLKIGAFQPEHKGKMEFYLEALDAQERMDGENPPIGIIICRDKNVTVSNTPCAPPAVPSASPPTPSFPSFPRPIATNCQARKRSPNACASGSTRRRRTGSELPRTMDAGPPAGARLGARRGGEA